MQILEQSAVHAFPAGDGPLLSLGDGFASRFHCWHGVSGQRYVMSVFSADSSCAERGLPEFETCVVVPVQRDARSRIAMGAFILDRGSDRTRLLARLKTMSIDEWHVHLLPADRHERVEVAADLNGRLRPDQMARLA